jgi:hypothetical protein
MRLPLLIVLVPALAYADQSVPAAKPSSCTPAHAAVVREIERLFKSAGAHASFSDVCADGDGQRADLKLLETCQLPRDIGETMVRRVWVRYQTTISYEVGGECSPYPKCAEAPPPDVSTQTAVLDFGDFPPGLKVTVPAALPGITLKTPLGKKHSTGCHGDAPAFTADYVRLRDPPPPAPADPKSEGCMVPMPSVVDEVKRLLASAGEHASFSRVCADGSGNTITVKLLAACIAKPLPLTLSVRYRVSTLHESGGECSGPNCGGPSEPSHENALATLGFNHHPDGMRIAVPAKLPAIPIKTPLGQMHSTGCHGDKAAFTPKVISSK